MHQAREIEIVPMFDSESEATPTHCSVAEEQWWLSGVAPILHSDNGLQGEQPADGMSSWEPTADDSQLDESMVSSVPCLSSEGDLMPGSDEDLEAALDEMGKLLHISSAGELRQWRARNRGRGVW